MFLAVSCWLLALNSWLLAVSFWLLTTSLLSFGCTRGVIYKQAYITLAGTNLSVSVYCLVCSVCCVIPSVERDLAQGPCLGSRHRYRHRKGCKQHSFVAINQQSPIAINR